MKIYTDLFTGDELCSDTFPMKLIDNIVYEFEGKMRVDTTAVSDEMIGGNKSAEGADADEGGEAASVSGINFVLNHQLVEFPTDKKSYMVHIKEYMKKVVEKLKEDKPAEVEMFQKNVQPFVKDVISNFDDFSLYCGASMSPDGMYCLVRWKEDKPFLYLFKHGLIEEKV